MSDLTIIVIASVLLAFLAALLGGTLIAMLASGGSRFFKRSLPSHQVMSEFNAFEAARLLEERTAPERGKLKLTPTTEPIIASLVGLAGVFAIVSAVLPAIPNALETRVQAEAESHTKEPAGRLAITGDLDAVVAELPPGDADSGSKLYVSQGCSGCHSLRPGQVLVGPSFAGLFTTSATRKPPLAAKAYLYESIVNPNALVVQGFQPNLMQQTYATTLSPQQMADLLAWMERDLK